MINFIYLALFIVISCKVCLPVEWNFTCLKKLIEYAMWNQVGFILYLHESLRGRINVFVIINEVGNSWGFGDVVLVAVL